MDQPRLQEDRVAYRQRLPCRGTASARALETSSLSAHVQSVSDVFGDTLHFTFLSNALEPVVAPSVVALANMC